VEDDALVRRTLTRSMTREGYDVIAAANGEEALAFAGAARGLTCVVSDLSMPSMDGETLARALRSSRPALPMVLISGNHAPDQGVLADLPRTFLSKPVTDDALLAAIRHVTGRPSPPLA
jgi:two-component system cell cycle sensor histidine kinase/response regulator CckA